MVDELYEHAFHGRSHHMSRERIAMTVHAVYATGAGGGSYATLPVDIRSEDGRVHVWTTDDDVNVDRLCGSTSAFTGIANGSHVRVYTTFLHLGFDPVFGPDPGLDAENGRRLIADAEGMLTTDEGRDAFRMFRTDFSGSYLNVGNDDGLRVWMSIILTAARIIHRHEHDPEQCQLVILADADDKLTTRGKMRLMGAMESLLGKTDAMMVMSTVDASAMTAVHSQAVHIMHDDGVRYDGDGHRITAARRSLSDHRPRVQTWHADANVVADSVLGMGSVDESGELD